MEDSWNKNMADKFNRSCINVLDKSMMEWYNNLAPRFMYVGRKPYHFGNECHTIFFGVTLIFLGAKIVEGKYILVNLVPKLYSKIGITVGIILKMCEPIFSTVKYVVMDFFVLQTLAAKGVYAGALVKNCRYWWKSVPGYLIDQNFSDK